jgi:hypothetical protein
VADRKVSKPKPLREGLGKLWGSMRHWWDQNLTRNDGVAAVLIGLGVDWVLILRNSSWATSFVTTRLSGLFTTGVAVTGILLGLTLTSTAIIADYLRSHTARGQDEEEAGEDRCLDDRIHIPAEQADDLIDAFIATTSYLGLVTVIGLIGLVPTGAIALKAILAVWTITTILAIVGVARSISLLRVVVRAIVHKTTT